jgi:hypothetical protein
MKKKNNSKIQPAQQKLFWLPIYKIIYEALRGVFLDFWKFVITALSGISSNIDNTGIRVILAPLIYLFGFAFAIATFSCVILGLAVATVVFLLITLSNYLIGGAVFLADMLYIKIKSISLVCPNCHERYELPTYICECNAEHTNLRPGMYGIFKRKCECGKKIPTTFFNGRQKMASVCPNPDCQHIFDGEMHPAKQICIPIVGGVSSGKTNLINAGIDEMKKFAENLENKVEFKYCSPDDEKRHQVSIGALANKTKSLDAYKIYFSQTGSMVKNRVYIYDVAGETYDVTKKHMGTEIEKWKVYGYTRSLLFILDPLSIEAFYEKCLANNSNNLTTYKRSEVNIDSVVTNLFNSLNAFNLTDSQLKNTHVAIAVTKSDMPLVKEYIGKERVSEIQLNTKKTWEQAQNAACEAFLDEFDAMNFLNQIKTKFDKYQFFACSSWNSETNTYEPDGAGDPFLWLIDMESQEINFKKKWTQGSK